MLRAKNGSDTIWKIVKKNTKKDVRIKHNESKQRECQNITYSKLVYLIKDDGEKLHTCQASKKSTKPSFFFLGRTFRVRKKQEKCFSSKWIHTSKNELILGLCIGWLS